VFLMLDELVYTDRWDLWLKTFLALLSFPWVGSWFIGRAGTGSSRLVPACRGRSGSPGP
jgi:hypothetical protein